MQRCKWSNLYIPFDELCFHSKQPCGRRHDVYSTYRMNIEVYFFLNLNGIEGFVKFELKKADNIEVGQWFERVFQFTNTVEQCAISLSVITLSIYIYISSIHNTRWDDLLAFFCVYVRNNFREKVISRAYSISWMNFDWLVYISVGIHSGESRNELTKLLVIYIEAERLQIWMNVTKSPRPYLYLLLIYDVTLPLLNVFNKIFACVRLQHTYTTMFDTFSIELTPQSYRIYLDICVFCIRSHAQPRQSNSFSKSRFYRV